jgi:hypothetical protein
MFQKKLCNGIPNATALRVLRKLLRLKAYELSIVQGDERESMGMIGKSYNILVD